MTNVTQEQLDRVNITIKELYEVWITNNHLRVSKDFAIPVIAQEHVDQLLIWIDELYTSWINSPEYGSSDLTAPMRALKEWKEEIRSGHKHIWVLMNNHNVHCAICGAIKHLSKI